MQMEKLISEFKRKMYLDGKSERTIEVYGNSVREFFKWFTDSYGSVEFKQLYRENIPQLEITIIPPFFTDGTILIFGI